MKTIIFTLLSVTFLFASVAEEAKPKLENTLEMQNTHNQTIEEKISKIEDELKTKAQERAEKAKIREAKIQKRDEELKEKAKLRENYHSSHNHSTEKEIKQELTTKQEVKQAVKQKLTTEQEVTPQDLNKTNS